MKLTEEQKQQNRRQIERINNWKELSGKNGFWLTAALAFLLLVILFAFFWLMDVIIIACKNGGLGGLHDFWNYLFAALKISSPGDLEGPRGWNIAAFLFFGIFATLLTPFLTAAITNSVTKYIDDAKAGRKVYKNLYGHYVLIGYNHYATQILSQILSSENESYAILMTTQNPIKLRELIENELENEYSKRVIIYAGDAIQKEKVDNLRLLYAEKLYLLDESEPHGSQYSRNLSVLKNIADAVAERTEPLEVYMQVNNFKAYNLMQRVDIPNDFFINPQGKVVIDLRPFNFYENWARLLWSFHKLPQYDTLDFEPLEGTDKHVHLVISSFNSMGRALLLEALRLCHYPNFEEARGKNKTIITIFDSRWEEMKDAFYAQYPNLNDIIDVSIDFHSIDINSSSARELITQWANEEKELLTIAICDKDPDTAMTKALNLPEAVFYQKDKFKYIEGEILPNSDKGEHEKLPMNESRVRVLVRQEQDEASNIFMPSKSMINYGIIENASYPHIRIFGMFKNGLDMKQLDDKIAICINGIYADESLKGEYYTIFHMSETECVDSIKKIFSLETQDHHWLDLWRSLPENMKWSNRFQADMYETYIAIMSRIQKKSIKEYDDIRKKLPEVEHLRWCAERIVAGWHQKDSDGMRVNERRIHKAIISYKDLNDEEKVKDYNVIATAKLLSDEAQKLFN